MPVDALGDKSLELATFKARVVDRCNKDLAFFAGRKYRNIVLYCLTCADEDSDEAASSLVVLKLDKIR